MPQNLTSIFPQSFLHKLINFPLNTLANLYHECRHAAWLFVNQKLHALDPLVCENACHIRSFILWQMVQKYQSKKALQQWTLFIKSLDELIQKIYSLPPINESTKQTIEEYITEQGLQLEIEEEFLFDIKFVFLSHLLTLTKKEYPSETFMLHEKTCLEALSHTGLVHNKVKSLVSSAQKELSIMSCDFIQIQSMRLQNSSLNLLLITRYDDHKRSYLPQYPTAKVIFLRALELNIPIIIKLSRYIRNQFHEELILGCMPSDDKSDFKLTSNIDNNIQAAIICGGVIYQEERTTNEDYIHRLSRYSLLQVLLSNFAAHPQFSGNLRETPCIYEEAFNNQENSQSQIAQEWDEYINNINFAKKEGCSLENPTLLFINHVFCDLVRSYKLDHLSNKMSQISLIDKINL